MAIQYNQANNTVTVNNVEYGIDIPKAVSETLPRKEQVQLFIELNHTLEEESCEQIRLTERQKASEAPNDSMFVFMKI